MLLQHLIPPHRFVLVFLQRTAKAVQAGRYFSVRLVGPVFVWRVPAKKDHGRNNHDFNQQSRHVWRLPERQGEINGIRYLIKASKARKLSEHAPLPRKAVKPIRYTSVRLPRRVLERRGPAQSNQGRNDYDFNQKSSHDYAD